MPKFTYLIILSAVQAKKKQRIVHDSGAFDIEKGQWLAYSDEYGPAVIDDEEFLMYKHVGRNGEYDKRLKQALKTGYL